MVIAFSLFAITLLGQNYQIDTRYRRTSLAGWHVVGDATWRATGGSISARLKRRREGG
jgi:hypothetical protein